MIRIFNTVINIQYQTKPLKSITYFSLVYYWSTKICIPFDCILWGQILAVSSFPTFLIENRIGNCMIGYQTLGSIGVKKSDRKTIASYFFSFLIWKISTRLASSHCFPLSPLFFLIGKQSTNKTSPFYSKSTPNPFTLPIQFTGSKKRVYKNSL